VPQAAVVFLACPDCERGGSANGSSKAASAIFGQGKLAGLGHGLMQEEVEGAGHQRLRYYQCRTGHGPYRGRLLPDALAAFSRLACTTPVGPARDIPCHRGGAGDHQT